MAPSFIEAPLTGICITYHQNGMVNQMAHANGVTDTQGADPNWMRRPGSLSSAYGATTRWSSGSYVYDGSGDVVKAGTSWFIYNEVSRIKTGTVFTGSTGGGTQKQQTFTYDPYGNLTNIAGNPDPGRSTPTSATTNRLTGGIYDAAGNLTAWNGATYAYDGFNMMTQMLNGTEDWRYMYTADDERFWSYRVAGNGSLWHVRDLDGKVLRRYESSISWTTLEDYIYRDGQLFAAVDGTGTRHFHLDHLGSPRLITNSAGVQLAYHVYYPFGEEATTYYQDYEPMKFTGHERDLASAAGTGDDLDYMHARFRSPLTARFLSVDPVLTGRAMKRPQAWNRYTYVIGNPLKYIDPYGELWFKIDDKWTYLKGVDVIEEVTVGSDGSFSSKQVQGKGTFAAFNGSQLTLYGKDGSMRTYSAVSGRVDALGRTQPGLQGVRNVGPISAGRYSFNPADIQNWNRLSGANQVASTLSPIAQILGLGKHGAWPGGTYAWGTQRVPLTPSARTDTLGRDNFFIHGGREPGSAGCIDLCGQAGDFFNAVSGTTEDIEVEVAYP